MGLFRSRQYGPGIYPTTSGLDLSDPELRDLHIRERKQAMHGITARRVIAGGALLVTAGVTAVVAGAAIATHQDGLKDTPIVNQICNSAGNLQGSGCEKSPAEVCTSALQQISNNRKTYETVICAAAKDTEVRRGTINKGTGATTALFVRVTAQIQGAPEPSQAALQMTDTNNIIRSNPISIMDAYWRQNANQSQAESAFTNCVSKWDVLVKALPQLEKVAPMKGMKLVTYDEYMHNDSLDHQAVLPVAFVSDLPGSTSTDPNTIVIGPAAGDHVQPITCEKPDSNGAAAA